MIRLTEIRLPIDHGPDDLEKAICKKIGISTADLIRFEIFKRAYDARKNSALSLIYTLDVSVKDEDEVWKRLAHDPHIRSSPDTNYHFVMLSLCMFQLDQQQQPKCLSCW
jgi:uncharacterized FAD-dependent dehydrogenase